MSAFLGPIHFWLYNKIKLQQSIVNELYSLGTEHNIPLQQECDLHYGSFEDKPLEEIIDESNIHGWLQIRVSQVEYKYAYCVTKLLSLHPDSFPQIESILFKKGKEKGLELKEAGIAFSGIYKEITDQLLDGMPCDHAMRLISQDDHEIIWERNICVHKNYWDEVGGNIHNYYLLRDAWIKGLADGCDLSFEKKDEVTYCIRTL